LGPPPGQRDTTLLSEDIADLDPDSVSLEQQPPSGPLAPPDISALNIRRLAAVGSTMIEDKRIITKGDVRYLPLPLAAWIAHASESALRNWIDTRARFAGRVIQTHVSQTNALYVSEESVKRVAERFVKWPSKEPAGPIAIGETDDRSGFLGMSDAAGIVGVSSRTMWLWASQGKAPTDKPLDVIKCTTSDYFYIRERDAYELKALVPRSGLQRGRRPQLAPQP